MVGKERERKGKRWGRDRDGEGGEVRVPGLLVEASYCLLSLLTYDS